MKHLLKHSKSDKIFIDLAHGYLSRNSTKPKNDMYAQQRLRSVCASAQSDQSSLCAQWVAKVSSCEQQKLIRLGGCPGWSESSLSSHSSFFWFCHAPALLNLAGIPKKIITSISWKMNGFTGLLEFTASLLHFSLNAFSLCLFFCYVSGHFLRIEITLLRFHRVMKNISLV